MKNDDKTNGMPDLDADHLGGRRINVDSIVEEALAELEARTDVGFFGGRHTGDASMTISTSPALAVMATLDSGAVYHVLVVEAEGYAVAQPDEHQSWEYVCLSDLSLSEDPGTDDIVRAVIDEAFGPLV